MLNQMRSGFSAQFSARQRDFRLRYLPVMVIRLRIMFEFREFITRNVRQIYFRDHNALRAKRDESQHHFSVRLQWVA